MAKVKLTYFDARGRAEIIRLTLKASKIEFEDVRIKKEDWPALKPNTPTGQLPFLEYGDKKLSQSMAIARSIAKKHGFLGKDDKEFYLIERAIGQITDFLELLFKLYYAPEDKKEEMKNEFVTKTGRVLLKHLESFIKDTGFFAGETPTLAEFYFIVLSDYLEQFPKLYDDFPKLKELRNRILLANAEVDEWVKTRPVTEK